MNSATEFKLTTGHVSNPERAMRMVLGLGSIVEVLNGGITGENHMFAASVLCIYLGMTAIMGVDPFYFLVEKLMKGYTNSPRAVDIANPQTAHIASRQSRRAA